MTSSTSSNAIIASLARNSPAHRAILTSRSIFRGRSSLTAGHHHHQRHRMRSSSSSTNNNSTSRRQNQIVSNQSAPIVDLNNNLSMSPAAVMSTNNVTPTVATNQLYESDNNNNNNSIKLDRVAILKAFAAVTSSSTSANNAELLSPISTNTTNNTSSRFEKPTSYREARRQQRHKQLLQAKFGDSPAAIEQEFVRLRDTVPAIAGRPNVSDLTIINEAISLICDLEAQLIRKLKCGNISNLPALNFDA